jgi:hypothetical protein
MAQTAQNDKTEVNIDKLSDLEKGLYRDYSEDLEAHDQQIADFDAFEAMDMAKTYDAVSKQTNSGLTDSMTATIYLERAARVAGQLPDGEVQAFGKRDNGKALFMDLLRQKWIYPNANAQRSFKTKMFMWQYGSSEYGYMPMYYDLNVSPSGYFGPDCWLWNPRNFIPQNGFTSVADMDYVHALAYKSKTFFEEILDEESGDSKNDALSGWNFEAIRDVIEQIKQKTRDTDPQRDTLRARSKNKGKIRQVCVATRYEAGKKGRWITFLPEFNYKVIRNIKNPHKNGRIPFVIKPCIPKFDSFYNIGDFQRSMPMQFANDGLDNFYFQGIKVNLFPPTVVNAATIIRHTVSQDPGSVWEVNGNVNDVKRLETSTAGLATYQNAKGMAKGAIQSIAGTTDTRANADNASDPGFGKTPEALRKISEREATRDGQDRDFLEEAMTELIDGMLSLIPIIAEKIPVDLFAKEVEDILNAGHTDLAEILKKAKKDGFVKFRVSESKQQMRLRIDPTKFQGLEYRFQLTPNSTAKKTKEGQLSAMLDFLTFVGKIPNALDQYKEATGKVPDWDYIFTQFGALADIDGMDKMFMKAAPTPPPPPPTPKPPTETIQFNYKDAPDDTQKAIEQLFGLPPHETPSPSTVKSQNETDKVSTELVKAKHEIGMSGLPAEQPNEPVTTEPTEPTPDAEPQNDPMVVMGRKFTDPALAEKARQLAALGGQQ